MNSLTLKTYILTPKIGFYAIWKVRFEQMYRSGCIFAFGRHQEKTAITFVDPYGYLLTSCFCDQKGPLNKMRPPTEDPGGYKFFPC